MAHHEGWPVRVNVLDTVGFGPEVKRRRQPVEWEVLADQVGVAALERACGDQVEDAFAKSRRRGRVLPPVPVVADELFELGAGGDPGQFRPAGRAVPVAGWPSDRLALGGSRFPAWRAPPPRFLAPAIRGRGGCA